MAQATLAELADCIGAVVPAKTYHRVVHNKRTLAYSNPRKDGAFQLDFRASELEGISAKLKAAVEFKGDRATLLVNGKHGAEARQLLEHVAKAAS